MDFLRVNVLKFFHNKAVVHNISFPFLNGKNTKLWIMKKYTTDSILLSKRIGIYNFSIKHYTLKTTGQLQPIYIILGYQVT